MNASGCLTMHACIASKAPRHSGALAPPPPLLLLLPALAPVPACCKEVDLRKHEKAATKEGPQGPSRKSAMQGHARASWMFLSTCSGVSGAPSLLEEEAEAEASVFCLFVGARSGPNFRRSFNQRVSSFFSSAPFSFSLSLSSACIQGTTTLFVNAPAARAANGLPFSLGEEAICDCRFFSY